MTMQPGRILCHWLENQIGEFSPNRSDESSRLEQLKRLSEFALVLTGMSRDSGTPYDSFYASWARKVAGILWHELSAATIVLRQMITPQSSADTRSLLLAYPALELVTGWAFPERSWIIRVLDEAIPGRRHASLAFTRDVAGLGDCQASALGELGRLRDESRGTSVQLGYDLTHGVFYSTKMGRREPAWSRQLRSWAHERLTAFGAASLRDNDLDLAAESAMGLMMAGFPVTDDVCDTIDAVTSTVLTEAEIRPHPRHYDAAADEFVNRYHVTLTALAAVAEFDRAMRRDR